MDLYRVLRVPNEGNVPPELGWEAVDGLEPAPTAFVGVPKLFKVKCSPYIEKVKTSSVKTSSLPQLLSTEEGKLRAPRGPPPLPPLPFATGTNWLPRANQTLAPPAKPSAPGGGDGSCHENFVSAFRVVLTRPSSQMPWGFRFAAVDYTNEGARVVAEVEEGTPLERWNSWQTVRGRPDLCVQAGDQLIMSNGHWAYIGQEVFVEDIEDAPEGATGDEDEDVHSNLVLDFARPVWRPMAPTAPGLRVGNDGCSLDIRWKDQGWNPEVMGWCVCLQDTISGEWYSVEEAYDGTARKLLAGGEVRIMPAEELSAHVDLGLRPGPYVAAVAALTETGWSPFSMASKEVAPHSARPARSDPI